MSSPKILMVTKNVPWPANSGEKMRSAAIARALASIGDVVLVGFAGEHEDAQDTNGDQITVRAVPARQIGPVRLLAQSVRRGSITTGKWWSSKMRAVVDGELAQGVDAVVIEHVQLAPYLSRLVPKGVPVVLDMHNVESELTRRLGRTTRGPKGVIYQAEAIALKIHERRAIRRFDLVTVVSDRDRGGLPRGSARTPVVVVPNAIDSEQEVPAFPETPSVCFVGVLSWEPNSNAAANLVQHVWPRVRAQVPDARLLLVGRDPTPELRAMASEDIEVTGTVAEISPWYADSQLALAPLLAGGGSRLKILEALAFGRPVLATSIGAEGLEDLVGRGVQIADSNQDFADALSALLKDLGRCRELGAAGKRAVSEEHSWAAATRPMTEYLKERTVPRSQQPTNETAVGHGSEPR